jgi:SAM-dependent methyltransferase
MRNFDTSEIAAFWELHPCGSDFVHAPAWKDFFRQYDSFKYLAEPQILVELGNIEFEGKRVLEIGLGQGAEAQRIIDAGARYNGIDLTKESVQRVKTRCEVFSLPFEDIQVMNAEKLRFADNSFDIVFSHGVLHHSPRIRLIVSEIHRVLRPGGLVVVMLYHRNSMNYQISIRFLRRIGILSLFVPGVSSAVAKLTKEPLDRLEKHRENLRRVGIGYLRMGAFIHKATDGPDNVFSSVFSRAEAEELFRDFRNLTTTTHHLNDRHFPLVRNLLSRKSKEKLAAKYGWHLWVKGIK